MTVGAPDHPIAACGALDQIGNQRAKLRWNRVAGGIRNIDNRSSGADHFTKNSDQEIGIAPRSVLGGEFDIISKLFRVGYRLDCRLDHLLASHTQFVLEV